MCRTTTTTAVGLLAAGILLTACSSNDGSRPDRTAARPAPTTTSATAKAAPRPTTPAPSTSTVATKAAAPGPVSCKAAIKAQYEPGTAVLTGAPSTPPECKGLSSDELSTIVTDVITENTGG